MKAVALLSGGLDSTLAIRVILDQGIDVVAVCFITPFSSTARHNAPLNYARKAMGEIGVELKEVYLRDEYFEMLKNPKHGYGKNMNPCTDCHMLMCREAKKLMAETNAQFVITGEVLGQRPMSQRRDTLRIVEKESGLDGLLLRPLSAKLLTPTLPEVEGWVDRGRLLGLSGRSRKPQMELAAVYGIKKYSTPAGGCMLTAAEFSRKLKDCMDHSDLTLNEVELLKVGRHFRLSPYIKLVVGRDEEENERIEELALDGDYIFSPVSVNGPSALVRGKIDDDAVHQTAGIVARYCHGNDATYDISYRQLPESKNEVLNVEPESETALIKLRI